MDSDDLAAIRQRADAATPGPWIDEYSGKTGPVVMDAESIDTRDHIAQCKHYRAGADAEFIAHAREDVPALLAEVDRLRNELAQMTALVPNGERSKSERIASLVCSATRLVQVERDDALDRCLRAEELLDGMTDEWALRRDDGMVIERVDGRRLTLIDVLDSRLHGVTPVHRRVTEWQEVQP